MTKDFQVCAIIFDPSERGSPEMGLPHSLGCACAPPQQKVPRQAASSTSDILFVMPLCLKGIKDASLSLSRGSRTRENPPSDITWAGRPSIVNNFTGSVTHLSVCPVLRLITALQTLQSDGVFHSSCIYGFIASCGMLRAKLARLIPYRHPALRRKRLSDSPFRARTCHEGILSILFIIHKGLDTGYGITDHDIARAASI